MPDGWRAQGGVLRSGWNTRLAVAATSPDNAVQVFFGDAMLPRRFIVPGQTGPMLSQLSGVYPGPDSEMLHAWQRADELAADLVRNRFDAGVSATHPRRDLLPIAQRSPLLEGAGPPAPPSGTLPATSAADVLFHMPDGRLGLLTLLTFGIAVESEGGAWWADGVHGYVAPPTRRREAANALLTLVLSLRENPQREVPMDVDTSRVEGDFQEWLRWLRDLQQAVCTNRLLADDAREAATRGFVPDWRALSGVPLERLLEIGNVMADR
jgi:hypothetical protein